MQKTFLVFLLAFLKCSLVSLGQQFCTDSTKIKFPGVAPAPWAIDGNINDWETILGPATGNSLFPFTPSPTSSFNFFIETSDFDHPTPSKDLRFLAFTHDDYNVYFYLRRLDNGHGQNSFFYFCDIDVDGFMDAGEPVFFASFNAKNVSSLSIGSYVPNTLLDFSSIPFGNYMVSPPNSLLPLSDCHADGYSIKGTINELFNSSAIPALNSLTQNEIFNAALTEDGFGVEFAIPWRYLKNWVINSTPLNPTQHRDIFTYHVSLMTGGGKYQFGKIEDNVGGCDVFVARIPLGSVHDLGVSGSPDFLLQNHSVTTLVPGLSYRVTLNYQNNTNVEESFDLRTIKFKNIQLAPGASLNAQLFNVDISFDRSCNGTIDFGSDPLNCLINGNNSQIVTCSAIHVPVPIVQPLQTVCVIINISLPPNNSVQTCEVEIQPNAFFLLLNECALQGSDGGGGKPINPVDFTLEGTLEFPNKSLSIEQSAEVQKKVVVYPNPSNDLVNVILPNELNFVQISLADYTGKLIRKINTAGQKVITINDLKAGFYLLNLKTADGKITVVKKLIVQ